MRSRLFFGLFGCVLGLALAPPRSEAQVLRLPTGFMWGSRLPDPAFDYQNDPYIKPIVHASVTDAILKDENIPNNQSGWVDFPIEDPVGFGRAVANRVRFRQVPAGKVVITIQGFGNDNQSMDVPLHGTEVDKNTNFFRTADRIGLGTSDQDWSTSPGGFPVPRRDRRPPTTTTPPAITGNRS